MGGLVGNNSASSEIIGCYVLGDVSGGGASEDVGCLVGTNYGTCAHHQQLRHRIGQRRGCGWRLVRIRIATCHRSIPAMAAGGCY